MIWESRILRAKLNGYFVKTDKDLAMSFQTCAIGEKNIPYFMNTDGNISYTETQKEILNNLYNLGIDFNNYVQKNEIIKAEAIYDLIQIEYEKLVKLECD